MARKLVILGIALLLASAAGGTLFSEEAQSAKDLREGVGGGGSLRPRSLYADQLIRRKAGGKAPTPSGPRMLVLDPAADAYVRDGGNAKKNFGGDKYLIAKVSTPNNGYNRISLLRFDLKGVKAPIARARLLVYGRTNDGGGTHVGVAAHGVTSDTWSEKTVTWDTRPSLGPYQSHLVVNNKDAWRVFDVTSFVRLQEAGDKVVTLALSESVGGTGLVTLFNSREATANQPRLELIPVADTVLPVVAITSSTTAASGTSAANTIDGKLSTRYSADGIGAQLTYDLGSVKTITRFGAAHQHGDKRVAFFDLWASPDNKTWKPVRGARTDGDTLAMRYWPLPPTKARYLRYVGLGNSLHTWNSITEVVILGK